MADRERPVRVLRTLTTFVLPLPMAVFVFDAECVEAACVAARDELGTSPDYATAPGIIEVGHEDIAGAMSQETWLRREHALQLRIEHLGPVEMWPRKWDRMILPYEGDSEVAFTVERVYLQEDYLLLFLATYQRPGFVTEEEMADGQEGVGRALVRRDGNAMGMLAWAMIHPEPGSPEFDPDEGIHYVISDERRFPQRESSITRVRRDPRRDG